MKRNVKELANAITMEYCGETVEAVFHGDQDAMRILLNMVLESLDCIWIDMVKFYQDMGSSQCRMQADWQRALMMYRSDSTFRHSFTMLHHEFRTPEQHIAHAK